jgi:hypothetical protein
VVDIEQAHSLGFILFWLVVILLVTIGTLVISRLLLMQWLWPLIKKTETKSAYKIFRFFETILLSFILLMGIF